jgi:hypothetical protein
MRTIDTLTGDKAREAAEMLPPFGPGLERRIVNILETLEVSVTDFRDPGGEYCEWKAFDRMGTRIATRRVRGY